MDRSKIVAMIAGAISVILAVAYLLLVMLLDFRGEMVPAPQSQIPSAIEFAEQLNPVHFGPWSFVPGRNYYFQNGRGLPQVSKPLSLVSNLHFTP